MELTHSTETKKRAVEAIQTDDEFMSDFNQKYEFSLKYKIMKQYIEANHPEMRPSSDFLRDCFHDLLFSQAGHMQVPTFIRKQINMEFLKPCTLDVVALNTANSLVQHNIEQFENSCWSIHTMCTHELVSFLVDKCITFPTQYARKLFDCMTVFEKLAYLAHVLLPERDTIVIKKLSLPLDYYVKKMETVVMRGFDSDYAWDRIIHEYKLLMRTKMQLLELNKLPLFQQAYNLAEDFVR